MQTLTTDVLHVLDYFEVTVRDFMVSHSRAQKTGGRPAFSGDKEPADQGHEDAKKIRTLNMVGMSVALRQF